MQKYSYDFVGEMRSLSEEIDALIMRTPILAALFGENPATTGLKYAGAPKHEWANDYIQPLRTTVTAERALAGATLTVASTERFEEGTVLRFEAAADKTPRTVQLVVTAINSATEFAVAIHAGTTDDVVENTDTAIIVSTPRQQGSSANATVAQNPTIEHNFTQIFRRDAKVTGTALSVKNHLGELDYEGKINYEVGRKMNEIVFEMVNAVIHGRRVEGSGSVNGAMAGLLHLNELGGAQGQLDAAAAALTPTIINNAHEQGADNGADNMTLILCAPNQARRISAFNVQGNNPRVERADVVAGSYVSQFVSDQPNTPVSTVVSSRHFPADKIMLIDPTRASLVSLLNREIRDYDSTPNDYDGVQRTLLGEYSLELKNPANAHMVIENLAV